jgi:polyisoprenoid-binding protein YceI
LHFTSQIIKLKALQDSDQATNQYKIQTNMEANKITTRTKWSVDQAHSEIAFKVRHLRITHVKGLFRNFDACIYTRGNDFTTAEIDLWIDATSINTRDEQRDAHLKSPDFFDVLNHKQISFTSGNIGKDVLEGNHELWGELTMMGISKNVKLNVEFGGIVMDPWGNEKAGFAVTGKINRSDWGLIWNTAMEAGGIMVGEEVTIMCDIELTNLGQTDLQMELDPVALMKMPAVSVNMNISQQ